MDDNPDLRPTHPHSKNTIANIDLSVNNISTPSATLAELLNSTKNDHVINLEDLNAASVKLDNLQINNALDVLGATTVNDLNITGGLTSGLITIDGLTGSIQTLSGPLKLQESALGPLEIMGGKVVVDKDGNVKIAGDLTSQGNIKTKGFIKAKGINLEDKSTGEYYCVFINNGEVEKTKGECE